MRILNTLLSLVVLLIGTSTFAQIFVADYQLAGNNDGTSWADAYLDLATAIENANEGDEIWVAIGIFVPPVSIVPNGSGFDTTNTYYIDKNLKLYAGFAGGETSIDQRNFVLDRAVIFGDVNGDDIVNRFDTLKEDNAHHLFYFAENITDATTLDGFYLWRGAAGSEDGDFDISSNKGGGIYAAGGIPTIRNTAFVECHAHSGGAIYLEGGTGLEVGVIDGCDIDRNNATSLGGGIYASDLSSIDILNTKISRNNTDSVGAVYLEEIFDVVIENCDIRENRAEQNAAIYSEEATTVTLRSTTINNNQSNAGCVYLESFIPNSTVTLDQTKIINNYADTLFTGLLIGGESDRVLAMTNSIIAGNTTGSAPFASQLFCSGSLELNHSTIAGAQSPIIYTEEDVRTSNSIFFCSEIGIFLGEPDNILSAGGNICSDNSMDAGLNATGDLTSTDPLFVDLIGGDFRPQFGGPCVDAAVASTVTVDVNNDARDGNPDIGAIENLYVATTKEEIVGTTIVVYPTITADFIKVDWASDLFNSFDYSIVDQRGVTLLSGKIESRDQSINVTQFAAGQYQIIFTNNRDRTSRSFIKM